MTFAKQLVAGASVQLASLKSSPELNGRQGKLLQYMGTFAEFNCSALDQSAQKRQVQLDLVDGGLLGTAAAKTIVAKGSNLVYLSGPPDEEDETWWTSPQEDEETAELLEQRLSQGVGDGRWADGGAGQAGTNPGGLSGCAEPMRGARDASKFKVRGCDQDALATER